MSETAASRPRPKPRPRPRPAAAQSSSSCGASGSNTSAAGILPLGEIVINDSDEQFVVNRGRTKETWKKLDKINEITATPESGSESDTGRTSTPLRKRAKKSATQKIREELRLLSTSSSSESDNNLEFIGIDTPGKGKDLLTLNKRKRQNERAKSRSLTPPPDLPVAVIANARSIVRQALDKQYLPSVPTYDDWDNSTDTIVLNPELERIAKAVNTQSPSIANLSGDGGERVVIFVKWQKHPLNALEQEPTWPYRMRVDESFRELFEIVAEDVQVLSNTVILSYNNKRVFPSTRPDSLGLCGEVEFVACHQNTYDYIHQQARTFRQTQSPARNPVKEKLSHDFIVEEDVINIGSDDEDESNDDILITSTDVDASHTNTTNSNLSPPKTSQEEPDAGWESDAGKFKLVLRSGKAGKNITLIVRPTTKCGSIVKAYIKKAGLAEQYPHIFAEAVIEEATAPASRGRGGGRGRGRGRGRGEVTLAPDLSTLPDPRICIDGDKMDNNTEIREADLDDGDMVDVVGL